jgi:hypothetical protein
MPGGRRWLVPLVLLVGVALGVALAAVAFAPDEERDVAGAAAPDRGPPPTLPTRSDPPVAAGGAPATDPTAAVEGFLLAESAADFEASWRWLAAEDRQRWTTAAAWVAAHEAFAPITGFSVRAAPDADGRVLVDLHLRAGLDNVLGLVPPRADATFATVAEDGGWRVAFTRSTSEPRYADEAGATDAARSWAEARQRCDDGPEYGNLVGLTGLADRLCGADGVVAAGAPGPLPDVDATRFVSAFGPGVLAWSRTVELQGPAPLRAVLAPVDDQWLVIGVLAAP